MSGGMSGGSKFGVAVAVLLPIGLLYYAYRKRYGGGSSGNKGAVYI